MVHKKIISLAVLLIKVPLVLSMEFYFKCRFIAIKKFIKFHTIPAFGEQYQYQSLDNRWIKFPSFPFGKYLPSVYGFYDPLQQIHIAEEIIKMCKEFLNNKLGENK